MTALKDKGTKEGIAAQNLEPNKPPGSFFKQPEATVIIDVSCNIYSQFQGKNIPRSTENLFEVCGGSAPLNSSNTNKTHTKKEYDYNDPHCLRMLSSKFPSVPERGPSYFASQSKMDTVRTAFNISEK